MGRLVEALSEHRAIQVCVRDFALSIQATIIVRVGRGCRTAALMGTRVNVRQSILCRAYLRIFLQPCMAAALHLPPWPEP